MNDDFEMDKTGLKYNVIFESKSTEKIKKGDYIELELKYTTTNDSVLFNSKEFSGNFRMQVAEISHQGGCFEDALMLMNPGDKYQFMIPADSFYYKTKKDKLPEGVIKGSELIFNINVIKKISSEEIEKERIRFEREMKEQELIMLQQFLSESELKFESKPSGLYYLELKKGNGKKAETGDILTVQYNGKLIDGKLFDSSYQRNEPFVFKLGTDDIITGWEEGFSYMNKGAKSIFIVPSELAYGKDGYGKIIAPFSTLIFEVELIDIK